VKVINEKEDDSEITVEEVVRGVQREGVSPSISANTSAVSGTALCTVIETIIEAIIEGAIGVAGFALLPIQRSREPVMFAANPDTMHQKNARGML
jgi:hypothetical protein